MNRKQNPINMSKCEWAWAIVHDRGLMHTNWILGNGKEAWPGMFTYALFATRQEARVALSKLYQPPFRGRIVKVHLALVGR